MSGPNEKRTSAVPELHDMEAVILCGGMGTRLREETEIKPKPMVEIGGKPILWHIMKIYSSFGVRNFVLCLGYRGDVIRDYFLNYRYRTADFAVEPRRDSIELFDPEQVEDWRVVLVDTGDQANTGARIQRALRHVRNDVFFATYGDGVANVNLEKLLIHHETQRRSATVTAVRPMARFGEIALEHGRVTHFREKPQVDNGWINGGYLVCERKVFASFEPTAELSLEADILPSLAKQDDLAAHYHDGFWQCMDTYREMVLLNEMCESGRAPWVNGDGW